MEYWCKWALSIYGWKYLWTYSNFKITEPFKNITSLSSFLRNKEDNVKAATDYLKIDSRDIVKQKWTANLHHPAYFIAMDRSTKNIVLVTRGTMSPFDLLTDIDIITDGFNGGRVHGGILKSSRKVYQDTKLHIRETLRDNPDYKLVLTGHSLGGAVSAVLTHMFNDDGIDAVSYCYGSPPIFTKTLADKYNDKINTVVNDEDTISRLYVGEQLYLPGKVHHVSNNEVNEKPKEHFAQRSVSLSALRDHLPDKYEECFK